MPETQTLSPADRKRLENLLSSAADLQDKFWDALKDIENELGRDLDGLGTADLAGYTVDDLLTFESEDE